MKFVKYLILKEMFSENCVKFLSIPACIIATEIRGIIAKALKKKLFDIVITTCGTLDHDIARTFKNYYLGYFEADDIFLAEKGIHRLGNVFVPKESYGLIIEEFMQKALRKIGKKKLATYELCWELGKIIEEEIEEIKKRIEQGDKEFIEKIKKDLKEEDLIKELEKRKENSILYWAYKNKIPVIIPGITDGAVGTQILMYKTENPEFDVDVWKDEMLLSEICFGEKDLGALMIGGGISKHHVIWWAQFGGGLKYAVYITSAVEQDGSLSGARTREAISWGKVKKEAKHVTVWGDATIILPIILTPFI